MKKDFRKVILTILVAVSLSQTMTVVNASTLGQESLNPATIKLAESEIKTSVSPNQYTKNYLYSVYLDGRFAPRKDVFNNPIMMYQGRAYLPLRTISEALGAKVAYDSNYKVAIVELGETRVEIPIQISKGVTIKNRIPTTVLIDVKNPKVTSLVVDSKIYLPIRFVAESIGQSVTFYSNTSFGSSATYVHFTSPGHIPVDPAYDPWESEKRPTEKGTYDRQMSYGEKWEWFELTQEWYDRYPPQVGGVIDVGEIDPNGPNNGNWN